VVGVVARPNVPVGPGDPLILTRDPSREAEVAVIKAELRELRARHHAEQRTNLVRSRITQDAIRTKSAALAYAEQRIGEVVLRSPAHGSFVLAGGHDLVGRFLEQGQLVGYVLGATLDTARVVIPQADASLVRERTKSVSLRLSRELGRVLPATIRQEVPGASNQLPSRALGSAGGGRLAVDPSDPDGLRTLEHFFQIELSFARKIPVAEIGGRVHVLLDHGSEPLSAQAARALRRLLLRRLSV
jgi:putative peptide zinc metalloprotease protein